MQIFSTPLPGYAGVFQQYLQHIYMCIHIQWNVRETLNVATEKIFKVFHMIMI